VGQYQKKHSLIHTHPGHQTSFINFHHLLRSKASLFNIRARQSFSTNSLQVLFGLPLGLGPSTSYFLHPIIIFFLLSSMMYCGMNKLINGTVHLRKHTYTHINDSAQEVSAAKPIWSAVCIGRLQLTRQSAAAATTRCNTQLLLLPSLMQFLFNGLLFFSTVYPGWPGSRVVSVLDLGTEGPGFKSQPLHCWVTVLGKLFTPIMPLFTKQRNW